uniref:Uncharacterized protein n=1 Tax=Geobacter sp. (strain M21) TaxID=443144 RepID=C6E605_GEOSM
MRKMFVTVLIAAASLQGAAQAAPTPAPRHATSTTNSAAGLPMPAASGMVDVIKGATLPNYKGKKIGDAFGSYSYFKQKGWRETRGSAGTVYVDFTGSAPARWLDFKAKREGVSASGIEVKFAIYPNGEYGVVMVSRTVVKTDGKTNRYPLPDVKSVLDAIYSNRKIDL